MRWSISNEAPSGGWLPGSPVPAAARSYNAAASARDQQSHGLSPDTSDEGGDMCCDVMQAKGDGMGMNRREFVSSLAALTGAAMLPIASVAEPALMYEVCLT